MADKTISPADKSAAIAAWHDADDDTKRGAAVKAYPFLAQMYSAAQNFIPAPAAVAAEGQSQPA